MIVKRLISAFTSVAVLATTAMTLSGCGSIFPEPDSTPEPTTESPQPTPSDDGVITNGEWLAMVNDAFGMPVEENSPEGEIQTAKDWGVIGENENVDMNAPVNDQFVKATLMRASGKADLNSTDEEIIQAAIESGVIKNPNDNLSSPENVAEALSTAQDEWSHQTFDENYDVKFADNVYNFTDSMSVTEVSMTDDSAVVPSHYVENLPDNAVVILPDGNSGGIAYKVTSFKDNGNGTSTLSYVHATVSEVYDEINLQGSFGDIGSVDTAEGVSYEFLDDNGGRIAPLSYTGENRIEQMFDAKIETEKTFNSLVFKKKLGAVDLEAGVKDIKVNTKVNAQVGRKPKLDYLYMTLSYTDYVSADTGFVFGTDEKGNTNIFDLDKKVSEASLPLGEITIPLQYGFEIKIEASLEFTATGEIKVVLSIANTTGFECRNGQFRSIKESNPKAELAINAQLGAYANLKVALVFSYIFGKVELFRTTLKVGPTLSAEMKWDSDVKIACADIDCWLTIELSVGLLEQFFKDSHFNILTIGKDNSPFKLHQHLENFQPVPECTVTGEKNTETTTEAPTIPVGIFALKKSFISISVGSSSKVEIESLPTGYSASDIIWESNNAGVVSVDASGNVTANSAGTVTITAKTSDGKYSVSCTVSAKAQLVANNNNTDNTYDAKMAA